MLTSAAGRLRQTEVAHAGWPDPGQTKENSPPCAPPRPPRRAHPRIPRRCLSLRTLWELEPEGQVPFHGHVWVERVVLEDHRDIALFGREIVDDAVADDDLALADLLQSGEHPQRGRLAATRRTYHDEQFTVLDREVEGVNGDGPVVENLRDAVVLDLSQVSSLRRVAKPFQPNETGDPELVARRCPLPDLPRSFADGNEDGIGDLPGLTEKPDNLDG